MEAIEEAIVEANERFYRALSERDLDTMQALWLQVDWVQCVHPNWTVLHGWAAIRQSWVAIFRTPARVSVTVSDVRVRAAGDVAWVACMERISTSGLDHLDTALAQATNIFVRRNGKWRLVAHHASPVPVVAPGLWEIDPESVH